MIFVTVGTHEQPFNRLVEEIDRLKKNNIIQEEVIIQTGYSTYKPKYCKYNDLFTYSEMNECIQQARVVIAHGGPASFIMPLQIGKMPIVVPRKKEFGEHVNNHQVEFTEAVASRYKNIIAVYEIKKLEEVLLNYDHMISQNVIETASNNSEFNRKLNEIIMGMGVYKI